MRRRCAFVIVRDRSNPPQTTFFSSRFSENPTFRELLQSPGNFFRYLGRRPKHGGGQWESDLEDLKGAIPYEHQAFLVSLPWVVELPGHLFLHCGLSFELAASATEQLAALHRREWPRSVMRLDWTFSPHHVVSICAAARRL